MFDVAKLHNNVETTKFLGVFLFSVHERKTQMTFKKNLLIVTSNVSNLCICLIFNSLIADICILKCQQTSADVRGSVYDYNEPLYNHSEPPYDHYEPLYENREPLYENLMLY